MAVTGSPGISASRPYDSRHNPNSTGSNDSSRPTTAFTQAAAMSRARPVGGYPDVHRARGQRQALLGQGGRTGREQARRKVSLVSTARNGWGLAQPAVRLNMRDTVPRTGNPGLRIGQVWRLAQQRRFVPVGRNPRRGGQQAPAYRDGRGGRTDRPPAPPPSPGRRTSPGTRCARCRTTARSCEMNSNATPVSRCKSASRFTICACTDTSRAETGSSQTTSSGSTDNARAMAMRWRWPPLNWCGRRSN